MRKLGFLLLIAMGVIACAAAPAAAISLTYIDTSSCNGSVGAACGGNTITYTLTYPGSASGTATFSVQNSANTTGSGQSWYVGWALFQFGQTIQATVSMQGWLVNSTTGTSTLTFNYSLPGQLNLEAINFTVGYIGNINGSFLPLLSRVNGTLQRVPEPASLLLVSAGLVGLGVWGRKKFFGQTQDS